MRRRTRSGVRSALKDLAAWHMTLPPGTKAGFRGVDLSAGIQTAQGTAVTDSSGTRQATLVFKPGTQATMTLADGTVQPLAGISVRATEYTVGPRGPATMPGGLPANSGYTYAVELSVDEAQAAGARDVQFSQPVPFYMDNFLGFAVEMNVPAGYYDQMKGQWVASQNGRVIKLVGSTGGLAELDITGDGGTQDIRAGKYMRGSGKIFGVAGYALDALEAVRAAGCAEQMGWSPWYQMLIDYGAVPAPEFI